MNKKILFLILLAVVAFSVASPAYAAKTLQEIVDGAKGSLVPLGGSLAAIAFIIAGIMFLTATGNPGRLQIAKGALIAAVIGIVIIVLAAGAEGFVKTFFGL